MTIVNVSPRPADTTPCWFKPEPFDTLAETRSDKARRAAAREVDIICSSCPLRAGCYTAAADTGQEWMVGYLKTLREPAKPHGLAGRKLKPPAPCGTHRGWARHQRDGEKPCRACMDAKTAYGRARRARAKTQGVAA